MSESERQEVYLCPECGVRKVGLEPWGLYRCYCCGKAWASSPGTEGSDIRGSEALASSGDEQTDLVPEKKGI